MKFFANLKSNHTRKSFSEYVKNIEKNLQTQEVVVYPPFTALDCSLSKKIKIGAQNFYPAQSGSFTGEITSLMLDEFEIKNVIIGHSERRELGENEDLLKSKFNFAKEKNWEIVYCIGENLDTFENKKTKEFLSKQLESIDLEYEKLTIAYEPIWAIGTGKSASAGQIEEILDFIRTKTNADLLYGGSVNLSNILEISKIQNCQGVLVGTASWDADNFIKLIKSVC
ncbi:triosephosphate isomerase [Campylobacter pinnipediorum subsp. caledonicus]|uniref:Triosephosphate isomerase n=1 Tax=Campylobacter pinnipediorum subsp. caledonicus TaxID=1874362 RepID=A0A1S6U6Y2_9BACT|nr:triose-phosphate isomerase [Campylobacter pinnipediorum]AQW87514.1 triosephosphate isomerase [Campylobacter pinnipediorum subsp. caledonicus]OPA72342.1 triose-phosphate isomerase [Campylobacter pinnipediorum subsp. caledonicus]